MRLSCVNAVIGCLEDVELPSIPRESVMQGKFVSENIPKFLKIWIFYSCTAKCRELRCMAFSCCVL